jgi:hypothetical protein
MGISNMSARYGAGDALGMGWAGRQASGMKPGQYNEYLLAMQRVMEDGISKGFIRSSEQVAQNLTMLSQMTGNNPLWQGEGGARRLSEMNAGLEGATDLSSTADILVYRAAQNVMANRGQEVKDYTDVMLEIEKGLTPELFKEIMKLNSGVENGGRAGIIELLKQQFNLSNTNARALYDGYIPNKKYTQAELDAYTKKPPDVNNPDLDAAKLIAEITNIYTKSGMIRWGDTIKNLKDELKEAINGLKGNSDGDSPLTPAESRAAVTKTLAELEATATNPASTGDDIRSAQNAAIDAQVGEGKRQAETKRMLLKSDAFWDKDRIAFFTGNGNPFTKNDDERAYDRFMAYEKRPETRPIFDEAIDILKSLNQDQIKKINENNEINKIILHVMTEETGKLMLEAMRELARTTIKYEE